MTPQNPPRADLTLLDKSHIFRGVRLVLDGLVEYGPIPLTTSGGFNRTIVVWAAKSFEWPHETFEKLLKSKKAPNELDFYPLSLVHRLLEELKLGESFKKRFFITDLGCDLRQKPMDLFNLLVPYFLSNERNIFLENIKKETNIHWSWGQVIDAIDGGFQDLIDRGTLCDALFGNEFITDRHQFLAKIETHIGIIQPLLRAGMLEEIRTSEHSVSAEFFKKSELWPATVSFRAVGLLK